MEFAFASPSEIGELGAEALSRFNLEHPIFPPAGVRRAVVFRVTPASNMTWRMSKALTAALIDRSLTDDTESSLWIRYTAPPRAQRNSPFPS